MAQAKSKSSGNKPLPSQSAKGEKVCMCCHEEKNLTEMQK